MLHNIELQGDGLLTTPVGFACEILKMPLYKWQRQILTWFEDTRIRAQGAATTPNGAGKSSGVIAALALWCLAVHPMARVIITTKDGKQLDSQLKPALWKYKPKFASWGWVTSPRIQISSPTGGFIQAYTTNDEARAEGYHKDSFEGGAWRGPLIIIVDEAKSVEDSILEAIDRCTYTGLLYISSPGLMMGGFYDAFTRNRSLYKTRKVSLEECPHIPKERIEGMIAKYGKDHPLVRSSIFGEFMDQDANTAFVFPLSVVQGLLENLPVRVEGKVSAFCDFAAGGDENVIAVRNGNDVTIEAAWRDRDTMSAAGTFINHFKRLGLEPSSTFGDADGMGKPICDRIREVGFAINDFHGGGAPIDLDFKNRVAECWHETARATAKREIRFPNDPDLVAQLTTRKCRTWSDGKLGIVSKDDMAKDGLHSPDRADAVVGAWCNRGSNVYQRVIPVLRPMSRPRGTLL